jgi:hypothetical protein
MVVVVVLVELLDRKLEVLLEDQVEVELVVYLGHLLVLQVILHQLVRVRVMQVVMEVIHHLLLEEEVVEVMLLE